jgi:hypothetical protein
MYYLQPGQACAISMICAQKSQTKCYYGCFSLLMMAEMITVALPLMEM